MKYDVLIFNIATGQVCDIADFCMEGLEARKLAYRLNDGNLRTHLAADAFECNSVPVGEFVAVDEERLDRVLVDGPGKLSASNDRFLVRYWRRKANSVCVACESPNLETTVHCAECARKNRERCALRTENAL